MNRHLGEFEAGEGTNKWSRVLRVSFELLLDGTRQPGNVAHLTYRKWASVPFAPFGACYSPSLNRRLGEPALFVAPRAGGAFTITLACRV